VPMLGADVFRCPSFQPATSGAIATGTA